VIYGRTEKKTIEEPAAHASRI